MARNPEMEGVGLVQFFFFPSYYDNFFFSNVDEKVRKSVYAPIPLHTTRIGTTSHLWVPVVYSAHNSS